MQHTPLAAIIVLTAIGAGAAVWWANSANERRVQAKPETVDELKQIVETLGTVAGVSIVCAQSPKLDDEASLKWWGRSARLEDLAMDYAERLAPGDEDVAAATTLTLGMISLDQQQEPERVWDDPRGCGEAMAAEADFLIQQARNGLKNTARRVFDLLICPYCEKQAF